VFYRKDIRTDLNFFEINFRFSNLLIGFEKIFIDKIKFQRKIAEKLENTYELIENFIEKNPDFRSSLVPLNLRSEIHFIGEMIEESKKAAVGPMAAVAGAFADELLLEAEKLAENIFIENGGDIALSINRSTRIMIFSGNKLFENKIGIELPSGKFGIASSSGKIGHSLSFGIADVVTVISSSATKSDAFATSIANKIKDNCKPEKLLEEFSFLDGIMIIWGGKLWYKGKFEIFVI